MLAIMMSFVQSMLGMWSGAVVVGLGAFVVYFVSYAGHEAGHFGVAKFLRAKPVVTITGVESRPANTNQALWISLAGPVAGAAVPLIVLGMSARWHLIGLSLTAVVLALNHLAMLLPWFPDGRIIKWSIKQEFK
jgi:hypothetical protein